MVSQSEFDFFKPKQESYEMAKPTSQAVLKGMTSGRMRSFLERAVVRWLYQVDPPTGIGLKVSTRLTRFQGDVAAFWSKPVRNPHREGPRKILQPRRSMIVQCFVEREECWPDCTRAAELVPQLEDRKAERAEAERFIQETEPELRDGNVLFEEYAEWRYEDSANSEYHRLQREIHKLERSLLHGTMFERLCSAEVADQLVLAVPAGVVVPKEMADGWGLLWVHDDLSVTVEKGPEMRDCIAANRLHLVQNIAASASNDVMFHSGVRVHNDGKVSLVQPPRGHRRPKKFSLNQDC
jgi:hypothetical protein